ncbi:hypothetical protein ACJJTC_014341, partial [Scirpophaga incertulas]
VPKTIAVLQCSYIKWNVILPAVTGSTDGIGKEYALELGRRGFNVVLISRNLDKLKAVAKEIETQHKVKTKIIVADFSRGAEVYPHIEQELKDIPVGVLGNIQP